MLLFSLHFYRNKSPLNLKKTQNQSSLQIKFEINMGVNSTEEVTLPSRNVIFTLLLLGGPTGTG